MRRALFLSALILALAGPAGAQSGRITVIAPSPAAGSVALRGSQSASPPRSSQASGPDRDADLTDPAVVLALSPSRPPAGALSYDDLRQCRATCAQTYYFCLGHDGTDECAPNWGQCRAACDAPDVSRSLAAGYPR